jgi:hypothetical protein
MQPFKTQDRQNRFSPLWLPRTGWMRSVAMLLAMAAFAGAALLVGQFPPARTVRPVDPNDQVDMQNQQGELDKEAQEKSRTALNAERRKHIADESAALLQLATELKAEVDKTDKDTLSLNVIRKAETIEKLAHAVKENMKIAIKD